MQDSHVQHMPQQPDQIIVTDLDTAMQASASVLAGDVAMMLGMEAADVFASLCAIPENLLTLLDSPQGWTALAGYVSADLGAPAPDYQPVMH